MILLVLQFLTILISTIFVPQKLNKRPFKQTVCDAQIRQASNLGNWSQKYHSSSTTLVYVERIRNWPWEKFLTQFTKMFTTSNTK